MPQRTTKSTGEVTYLKNFVGENEDSSDDEGESTNIPSEVCFMDDDDERGDVIPDSGCKKSVASARWRKWQRARLAKQGLKPVKQDSKYTFACGDGRKVKSNVIWLYPISIRAKASHADIAEVDCTCPPLFSVEGMQDLGVVLDFSKSMSRHLVWKV